MGMRGAQPFRDDGKQWHAFPERGLLWRPPADAGFTCLQAGVPSRFPAEENGPLGAPVLLSDFDYNHGNDSFKVMDADTGMVVYSRDGTCHKPWKLTTSPLPTVEAELSNPSSSTEMPEYVYISPPPVPAVTPAIAPASAPAHAAPVSSSAPPLTAVPASAPSLPPPYHSTITLFGN